MRSDLTALTPVLAGMKHRQATGDGLAHARQKTSRPDSSPMPIGRAPERLSADTYLNTLRERRSSLHYKPGPVDAQDIITTSRAALARDATTWSMAYAFELEVVVFAFQSAPTPPGVYRVTTDGALRIADAVAQPEELGIQREFASAAGIFSIYANLERADDWAGAHGYRMAMVRGAMVTYDVHFNSLAHGLAGTIFGGFIGASVRTLIDADGSSRCPVLSATYALPNEPAR